LINTSIGLEGLPNNGRILQNDTNPVAMLKFNELPKVKVYLHSSAWSNLEPVNFMNV